MRRVVLSRRDFIELSESVLNQYGSLRFEARGSSMYPFIRSGDVLTVRPTETAALSVGDVALYRATGYRLVAHRVVRKYTKNGHVLLTMRGDAMCGPGEQIQARQILGQVASVLRGRETIPVGRGLRGLVALLWTTLQPLGVLLSRLAQTISRIASRLLCCLQRLRFYRSLARRLIRKQVRYRVAEAEEAREKRDRGMGRRGDGGNVPLSPCPSSPLPSPVNSTAWKVMGHLNRGCKRKDRRRGGH